MAFSCGVRSTDTLAAPTTGCSIGRAVYSDRIVYGEMVGQIIMRMHPTSDNPKFPFTLPIHAAGVALFIVALYLLGITLASIGSSFVKLTGAAIVFVACDALALEG